MDLFSDGDNLRRLLQRGGKRERDLNFNDVGELC